MHDCESDLALGRPITLQVRWLTLCIPLHLQFRSVLSHKGTATHIGYLL